MLVTVMGCLLLLQRIVFWRHILVDSIYVVHVLHVQERDAGTCVTLI
jgi:hypothetical protein